MLRINNNVMDLDLSVLGFIRLGHVVCPTCGCSHLPVDTQQDVIVSKADPLYGHEAKGQVCEHCHTPLMQEVCVN